MIPFHSPLVPFIRVFWRHHVGGSLRVHSYRWSIYFEQQHMHVTMRFHFWQRPLGTQWLWALWKVKCQQLNERKTSGKGKHLGSESTIYSSICWIELTCWPSCEVQQIQSAVEHFIAKAHECEHILLIVKTHDEIFIWIEEFVGCFALHCWSNRVIKIKVNPFHFKLKQNQRLRDFFHMKNLRLQIDPVASNINDHGNLEPKHVARIKIAQCNQQPHCATTIRQLIQHASEFGA